MKSRHCQYIFDGLMFCIESVYPSGLSQTIDINWTTSILIASPRPTAVGRTPYANGAAVTLILRTACAAYEHKFSLVTFIPFVTINIHSPQTLCFGYFTRHILTWSTWMLLNLGHNYIRGVILKWRRPFHCIHYGCSGEEKEKNGRK